MGLQQQFLLVAFALASINPVFAVRKRSTNKYVRRDDDDGESSQSKPCRGEKCQPPPSARKYKEDEPCPTYDVKYASIEHYLNPNLFEDGEILEDIAETLRGDDLVVIHDAFIPEFAEALHCELERMAKWPLDTGFNEDGFQYSRHAVTDRADYSALMNSTLAVFEHPDTKKFMSTLSGRNCMGGTRAPSGSACYHMSGDYSLPHNQYMGQRAVSYQWLLSHNWQPEWGGALYWTPESSQNSYVHAEFNTLALFAVNPNSQHFTTQVSPHAKEKRLSFDGWFHSDWLPALEDPLEDLLETREDRWQLTRTQAEQVLDLVHGTGKDEVESERRKPLDDLVDNMMQELFHEESESVRHL